MRGYNWHTAHSWAMAHLSIIAICSSGRSCDSRRTPRLHTGSVWGSGTPLRIKDGKPRYRGASYLWLLYFTRVQLKLIVLHPSSMASKHHERTSPALLTSPGIRRTSGYQVHIDYISSCSNGWFHFIFNFHIDVKNIKNMSSYKC